MKGIFELRTAGDLLAKLEHDFSLLRDDPGNSYAAFNFFVTAEHLLDWVYPGYENKKPRESLRSSELVLQVCSHIATGAKHFVAQAKQHESVSGTKRPIVYQGGALPRGAFPIGAIPAGAVPGTWSPELLVELSGDAAKELGNVVHVLELAERVVEFWRKYLKSESR
jgi:hypothetical protein